MENDIIYFIEHTARELDIACALKTILFQERGIKVTIKSIAHHLDETVNLPEPKLVILPHCNGVYRRPPEKMLPKWPHAKYFSLAYEQVLGKAQLDYLSEKDAFTRHHVFHSVWGEFYKQILIRTGVDSENIRVNGSPTLNLYRAPYRDFYPQAKTDLAENHNLSPQKRWVFIPGNYGWAFFHDKLVRDRIRRGFNPEHAYQYREFSLRSLEQTAAWWAAAGQLADVEIIVRPRPATPEKDFRAKLFEFGVTLPQNAHIIKDGTVREWIMASDIVMSSFSTTLIEAAVAQKPVYMLTPVPLPDFIFTEWYDHVDRIQTLDDFLRACSEPGVTLNWHNLENWVEETLFCGSDAIRNIADTFIAILDHDIHLEPPTEVAQMIARPAIRNFYRKSRKRAWFLYQATVNAFGYKTPEQKRQAHEKDHLSEDVIDSLVEKWQTVLYPTGNHPSKTEFI